MFFSHCVRTPCHYGCLIDAFVHVFLNPPNPACMTFILSKGYFAEYLPCYCTIRKKRLQVSLCVQSQGLWQSGKQTWYIWAWMFTPAQTRCLLRISRSHWATWAGWKQNFTQVLLSLLSSHGCIWETRTWPYVFRWNWGKLTFFLCTFSTVKSSFNES